MSKAKNNVEKLNDIVSVKDFGAVGNGIADDTAAIQSALNSGEHSIYLPEGTYLFSTLTVNQNTRVHGASTRTSILKHTGSGTAITCAHTGATEPDGTPAYIESGWFIFQDLELFANGAVGFDVGNTRSSFTNWERVYIRHRQDGGTYFPGSVAIKCDNAPWTPNKSTYLTKLEKVFIRGFETGLLLNAVVNAWTLNCVWMIEVKDQVSLNQATGININNCYFESSIAAARGVVFNVNGGNAVYISGSTFELTNVAATQYAYDFTAGGTWTQITISNVKYLLQGDGNALNSKRINGTAPDTFIELNRSYTSPIYGNVPMLWGPGVDASVPFQLPNTIRSGGFQQGQGKILLGRNDGDDRDLAIAYDALSNWSITNSNNVKWLTGLGSPEGVVTADVGSLYANVSGGANTTLYVKESGSGNTGWIGK